MASANERLIAMRCGVSPGFGRPRVCDLVLLRFVGARLGRPVFFSRVFLEDFLKIRFKY